MIFRVWQAPDNAWAIVPDSGKFENITVIHAGGVSMRHVKFSGKTAIGAIHALWGAKVIVPYVFDDPCTLQSLRLGRPLYTALSERLTLDYDGFTSLGTVCSSASRLLLIGEYIYAKGAR